MLRTVFDVADDELVVDVFVCTSYITRVPSIRRELWNENINRHLITTFSIKTINSKGYLLVCKIRLC